MRVYTSPVDVDAGAAREKLGRLRDLLADLSEVVVGYSGGADSSFLALVAHGVLGPRVVAAIADSPSLPRRELREAIELARKHGIRVEIVRTAELNDPSYRRNSFDRCARCKDALADAVFSAPALAGRTLLLGVNVDDLKDHRPGQEAARRRGARFPLVEAGLSKDEVRLLSRELGLETWDKPAAACTASRVAYGVPVTIEALSRVERAEERLRDLGLWGDVRVRDQGGDLARIEVPVERIDEAIAMRAAVVDAVRGAGFSYVTLDLEGFRSGSQNLVMNEPSRATPADRS